MESKPDRCVLLGAAGRDYFNFLQYFKDNPAFEVVCFTAAQIPGIEKRVFPKELAGKLYPKGILIYPEEKLAEIIVKEKIDDVFLCYSDLSFQEVMEKASIAIANGANFGLLGTKATMIKSKKPVISVTAVRTGSGKSQTSRKIGMILRKMGFKVVVVRHPMAYGDLRKQEVERFANYSDLAKNKTTIEENEEYEPWIKIGIPVYAGVDYTKILMHAEKEADIIIWDGGNNDFSFYKPDLNIVVVDPLRAGHEVKYYPGMINFLMADVIIINKIDHAQKRGIKLIESNIAKYNPRAVVIKAKSKITFNYKGQLRGKKVIVVEDGPTVTHGGMKYGAGTIVAKEHHCRIVDASHYAVGSIKETYKKFKHLDKILPAMGYSKKQVDELQQTIGKSNADLVIDGSPADLSRIMKTKKPIVRVNYELDEIGNVNLASILKEFVKKNKDLNARDRI